MGRSGYVEYDDYDYEGQWAMIRANGARKSALRGKRGQLFLRRLAAALDAMPVKALIAIPDADDSDEPGAGMLGTPDGKVCVLGALALACGEKPHEIVAENHDLLAKMFDVAPVIVRDLEWDNDEYSSSDEERWKYLREWATRNTKPDTASAS